MLIDTSTHYRFSEDQKDHANMLRLQMNMK